MNSSESATYTVDIIGEEIIVSEVSKFLMISDLRFFLSNKRLYLTILPRVQDELFKRTVSCSSSNKYIDVNEIAIRLILNRFREIIHLIGLIERYEDESIKLLVEKINEMCNFFSILPFDAKNALQRSLPSLSREPLNSTTLRNHCLDNLNCRLTHLKDPLLPLK
jgi:hypothetical protein